MAKRFPIGKKKAEAGEGDAEKPEGKPEGRPRRARPPRERRDKSKKPRTLGRLTATARKAVPSRKSAAEEGGEEADKPKRKRPNPLKPFADAFTRVLAILGAVIVGIYGVLAAVVKVLIPPARAVARRIDAAIAAVSRVITPTRGLLLAAVGCALLLALSQFADYRGIEIGGDVYSPGIQSVAPAPEVQREALGSAHSYLMIPLAALAALVLVFAVRSRRWQLCRLVVLFGLIAVAVAIFVDRPAGLDVGDLDQNFNGVEAKLLGGYWMQIFAGAGLALTAFLLGAEIKREGRGAKAPRQSRKRSRPRSRSRGTAERGGAKPEGAGA